MRIYKLTFAPELPGGTYEPERILTFGSEADCRTAWSRFVERRRFYGVERNPDRYRSVGLTALLGSRFGLHIGGAGLLAICAAPEMSQDPVYRIRFIDENAWTNAGDLFDEAEVVMRRMGGRNGRELVLCDMSSGSLTVWRATPFGHVEQVRDYVR